VKTNGQVNNNTVVILIAIENYYKFTTGSNIPDVSYAINDLTLMRSVFMDSLKISNIHDYLNEKATKTVLENEIPYIIRNLPTDSTLIVYYVGHGCYAKGQNRITAYDSNSFNLSETTLSIDDLIFSPILKSRCKKCIVFLDACSESICQTGEARAVIDRMNPEEFQSFTNKDEFSAIFCASAPGKKSYPSNLIHNGIWTWHLAKALKGEAKDAIERENIITNISLQDFLSESVRTYIRKETTIRDTQEPYALFKAGNRFAICEIPVQEPEIVPSEINIDYNCAEFVKIERFSMKSASWFNKKYHFVPTSYNSTSVAFVQENEYESIKKEAEEIYSNIKKVLNLRRRDIDMSVQNEGVIINTDYFRFNLIVDLDKNDPSEILIKRQIILRKQPNEYPENFDEIFTNKFNEIYIPYSGSMDFDELVDRIEEFQASGQFELEDNQTEGTIQCTYNNGLELAIDTIKKEIKISPYSASGCLSLISAFQTQYIESIEVSKLLLSDE
jgi:hypothetical protein